jgi:choline dehydrogenase-like flavoprotein
MIRRITPSHARHIYSASTAPWRELESGSWDACVIGSGPGGSVVAASLAQAGKRVLLVERGAFRPVDDLNFSVLDMAMRLGQVDLTAGGRTTLHSGRVLGGGSVIFGAVAMQPPSYVFDEWGETSGIAGLTSDLLAPHYAYVGDVLSVTRQSVRQENRANAIVRQMAAALGHDDGLELAQRYTAGCRGTGLCTLGCGFDLKGTMVNSFLPLGLETGNLTIVTECEAVSLEAERSRGGGRAVALQAVLRAAGGAVPVRLRIRAKCFVSATGSLPTSALLMRSRLRHARCPGGRVSLQPHGIVHAIFDEPVTYRGCRDDGRYLPMNGVPAIYNFTGLLRQRGYYWFASSVHPSSLAAYTAHLPAEEHRLVMKRFHYTSSVTVTLRDNPEQSSIVLRGDTPLLDFRESVRDCDAMRRCFLDAARALLAVGARHVFLPMLQPPCITSDRDLPAIAAASMSYDRLLLYSDHTSGGNALGTDSRSGVTDLSGRVHGTTNVYVADASLFPSACGVAPSWTIMAFARMIAANLAGTLRTGN